MRRTSRRLRTGIPCPVCAEALTAERACRGVTLYCARCDRHFALRDYLRDMDEALEAFIADVPCDRV